MPGQGNRSAILHGDTEDLGLRPEGQRDLVSNRTGADGARRSALRRGELLCRVDLGARVDATALSEQGIVGVLDVLDQLARRAVEPDVGDHSVNRRVCARGEGRVADHGFGVGMTMMRINKEHAVVD